MIYIIGANGFVGSALVARCEQLGLAYKSVTRDSYDSLVGTECDVIINANGNSKKFLANQDPKLDFQLSVESVLKSTQDFKFGKYIHLSTCDVYDNTTDIGANSEATDINVGKLSHYGANKYMAELVVKHYCADWTIFRLGGMVGPNLRKNPIFDLIWGEKLFVHPESEMQFLRTAKVAETILDHHGNLDGEILNLVAAKPLSIREITGLLETKRARNWDELFAMSDAKAFRYEISSQKLMRLGVTGIDTRSNLETYFSEVL